MATLESLKGSDKLREAYPKINKNFNELNKETNDLRTRVNTIITTPIDGEAAAQEVVDARTSITKGKTFDTLGARLEEIEQEGGSAEKTAYDNIDSELEAENVQAAIDETVGMVKSHEAERVTQVGGAHGLYIESGTFTPIFRSTDGNPIAETQNGIYERVGKLVFVYIQIYMLDKNGATGPVAIEGLPFSPSPSYQALSASYMDNLESDSPWANYITLPLLGSSEAVLIHRVGGRGAFLQYSDVSDNFRLILSGTYRIIQ